MLSEINKHERDHYISFVEEGHIYTLLSPETDEVKHPISVTTLISKYYPHFDADKCIEKMMNSRNWPNNKYYGMTPDEIKSQWDETRDTSAKSGTAMHANIESYLNSLPVCDESDEFKMFLKFWGDFQAKYSFKPYRLEWCVYDELFRNGKGLCGSIDCVLSDGKGNIMIFDWKRSKEIKVENSYEKMNPPFDDMDNTNLSHYKLQLNVYRHILIHKYKLNVVFMMLVILHPNQTGYHTIKINPIDLTSVWHTL